MRISLVQADITWEDKETNLCHYSAVLSRLKDKTDLVVLPEMCTTGFSMNSTELAESDEDTTVQTFKKLASENNMAVAGSFIGLGNDGTFYNRGFFIEPDGKSTFYNKRHLFRMGEEAGHFAAGREKVIVTFKGWNICLAICYDLRFPVWLRNINNEYDLLLVMANWPESRQRVFDSLLTARAIENQAVVCGVNRIGTDGNGLIYVGGSSIIDAYGRNLTEYIVAESCIETVELSLDDLQRFREKFPVWKDADAFKLSF